LGAAAADLLVLILHHREELPVHLDDDPLAQVAGRDHAVTSGIAN
jgi:hypothetical protein